MAHDVPELVSELRKRSARIVHLEAQIMSTKQTPHDLAALLTRIENVSPRPPSRSKERTRRPP
jgi:hypothetical protein